MSRISREIRDSMRGFNVGDDGEITARFVFKEDFIGFQGHFPSRKVLPGVCQIQCIKTMLREWKQADVMLREIVNAKYLLPVSPGDELTCTCKGITDNGGVYSLRASIRRGEERVSEFRLHVAFAAARKEGAK